MNNQEQNKNNQNQSQPMMSYRQDDGVDYNQDDITRPQEYYQQPALNNLGQDPYLSNQGWQDFDRDYEDRERIQEVDEGNNSGLPSLGNSQLPDNRRLS